MQTDYSNQFANRVALVTGGTQGLGEATARLFARRGAIGVAICGRNIEHGTHIAKSITDETDCPVLFVPTDLMNIADCKNFVDQAAERFGRIDIFAGCAGTTERGSLDNTSEEVWNRIFAVNVRAPFFLIQRIVPWMRKNDIGPASARGWIVNVISISSHGGQPFLVPYSASKGALRTLTKNIAFGLLSDRIRVNGINLGWANTPSEHQVQISYHNKPDNWLEHASTFQPFGRLIEPNDVAHAVAFLTSEDSGIMTGSIIDYDQSVIGCRFKKPGE